MGSWPMKGNQTTTVEAGQVYGQLSLFLRV